jgi:galactokinase
VESGKKRELAGGDYNLRRTETQAAARAFGVRALRDLTSAQIYRRLDIPELLRRRALHIVEENERVWRAVEFLEAQDGRGFGKLMNASHESSRRNFQNSTPELDFDRAAITRRAWCAPNRSGVRRSDRHVVRTDCR